MQRLKIYNGKIITPYRIIPNGCIFVTGNTITAVSEGNEDFGDAIEIDAKGKYVAPGFIDIHVHGGGGHDFMDGTETAFLKIAELHAQYGTTAMLPTTLSGSKEELLQTLSAYKEANRKNTQGAQFLGMHMEGPYFAMNQRGAQDPRYIRDPDPEEYKEAQELADIKKEKAVVAAKKFLIEKKDTLKYKEKAATKAEEKPAEKIEIPKETVDKYIGEVNKFFSPAQGEDFDRFIFQDDEDEDIKVAVIFTKEEIQNMKKETTAYLHSLSPYDKDKKIPNFDSGKLVAQIADILYGDQIKERMLKEVKKLAQTLRIEQLAETKPDKKSGGGGKGKEGIPSVEEQFAELGKKAVIDRGKKK